jgi:hypothetical protein
MDNDMDMDMAMDTNTDMDIDADIDTDMNMHTDTGTEHGHQNFNVTPTSKIGPQSLFHHCFPAKPPYGPSSLPYVYCMVQPCTIQQL